MQTSKHILILKGQLRPVHFLKKLHTLNVQVLEVPDLCGQSEIEINILTLNANSKIHPHRRHPQQAPIVFHNSRKIGEGRGSAEEDCFCGEERFKKCFEDGGDYMTKEQLLKMIGSSESTTVEWKPSLAQIHEIIESITAFANTEGGRLFIGISKDGEVNGVSIGKDTVENLANRIAQHTEPKIQPKITVKKIDDKSIIIVEVKASNDKLVLANGGLWKKF